MAEYRNQTFKSAELRLVASDLLFNCTVADCDISIMEPETVCMFGTHFERSRIEVHRVCRKHWDGCFFDNCGFAGAFENVTFGIDSELSLIDAGLRACRFADANLNFCAYLNCDPHDLQFPKWPHATVFNPSIHAEDFSAIADEEVLMAIRDLMAATSPNVAALTIHLEKYVHATRQAMLHQWKTRKLLAIINSQPEPTEPSFSLAHIREQLLLMSPSGRNFLLDPPKLEIYSQSRTQSSKTRGLR